MIAGVTVAGGYAGLGAPDPDARDVEQYPTILSGDLAGDDAADSCCAIHDAPGCNDPVCELDVCEYEPSCCADSWDGLCWSIAFSLCADPCLERADNAYTVVTALDVGASAILDGFTVTGGNADGIMACKRSSVRA